MKKFIGILTIAGFIISINGCASDTEIARQQQCTSLRYELTKVHSNPDLIKNHMGTRRYQDMRLEYGALNCKSLKDYVNHYE